MREIVRAKHVLLEFNGRDVLNISELSVAENERIGLIGANGSGKTSLLRILSGDMETAACRIVRYGNVLFVPQVSVEDSHRMVPTEYMASIWGVKNYELIPQLSVMSQNSVDRKKPRRNPAPEELERAAALSNFKEKARPQPGVSASAGEVRRGRSAPPPPRKRQLNFGSQSPCASMSASHMAMVVSISSSLAVCGSSSAA